VLSESEVLQELDKALLAGTVWEDRHVDLFRVLTERVIEDDLEESLTQLEPVHLDFERADLQTRLSAGGVADEWVTQLLRQGDAKVFKKYSQMKLQMKREALAKLNRHANERV